MYQLDGYVGISHKLTPETSLSTKRNLSDGSWESHYSWSAICSSEVQ